MVLRIPSRNSPLNTPKKKPALIPHAIDPKYTNQVAPVLLLTYNPPAYSGYPMLPRASVHRKPIRLVNHGPKKHVTVMKAYNRAFAALTRSGLYDPPTPRPLIAFHIWFGWCF